MPELVLKQKIGTPTKGNSYIVHSNGFVYEVEANHLLKYYSDKKKYKVKIQDLVDKGKKLTSSQDSNPGDPHGLKVCLIVTKKKVTIEIGYLYYVTKDGVARAKLPTRQ